MSRLRFIVVHYCDFRFSLLETQGVGEHSEDSLWQYEMAESMNEGSDSDLLYLLTDAMGTLAR